jgi:6-pyruvoyltetrahydropterin/6-carboxytetrahydropterin synthase
VTYLTEKTFPPISCCYRNWRADTHCRFLHGYALEITVTFSAATLDPMHWGVDFGKLRTLKEKLEDTFDHKTLIESDDPYLEAFRNLSQAGLIELRILPGISCEKFAQYVFTLAEGWLTENDYDARVWVNKVTVREHHHNAATFQQII